MVRPTLARDFEGKPRRIQTRREAAVDAAS